MGGRLVLLAARAASRGRGRKAYLMQAAAPGPMVLCRTDLHAKAPRGSTAPQSSGRWATVSRSRICVSARGAAAEAVGRVAARRKSAHKR